MSEFSRRVDVELFKDEPKPFDEWHADNRSREADDFNRVYMENRHAEYSGYLNRFQPYRWRAVAANNEPIAHGESYFNLDDCLNAIDLLLGDNTTVYYAPMFGDDRGFKWLRYGKTDRDAQATE